MCQTLKHAQIVPRRSTERGHADHGWLNTYHTLSFASYQDPRYQSFGALRVLNEDRVHPNSGFPFHTHRNAEIFSYVLSGELTHRDSMMNKAAVNNAAGKDQFYRIRRGDVQFTTGGSGISHSEHNEHHSETVHFLQIWVLPWKSGLTPRYHDLTIDDAAKHQGFVTIISPLRAGQSATPAQERAAVPVVEGTIPIHADFLLGASIIAPDSFASWKIGGNGAVDSKKDRKVFIHLPMTKGGRSKVRLPDGTVLAEGDGAFVTKVDAGDVLQVQSVGIVEAESAAQTSNGSYGGSNTPPALNISSSYILVQAAIQRAQARILNDSLVPWKFHPRNSNFEPPSNATKTYVKNVTIQQNGIDAASVLKPMAGEVNESYTLSITTQGAVEITAVSSIGILRALETFTQLFYQHSVSSEVYCPYAPVSILDAPKFAHRGLNMDVARNFYPPSFIMHTIDALAWNKFNRLHLHVTDAQSWPLDIPALPDLSAKGAYRKGLSYTPAQLAEIQAYGMYRGVEVHIEIDMPGHTSVLAFSYPELITAYNIQPNWSTYANEPPSGSLKLNSSAVYDFLHRLWEDLLPRVAPYSAYFHTGGDEVNVNAYSLDDTVKSNQSAILQPLLQRLVDFNHAYIRAAGMTPIVWEEMLLDWNLTLGSDVIVQTWYLDCGHGSWVDPPPTPDGIASPYYPYYDYCSPLKNWHLMYSHSPFASLNFSPTNTSNTTATTPTYNVPPNSSSLIIGGEVHIWSELTDPVNFDAVVWPRAAAAAEVLWSGNTDAQGKNRSLVEVSARLAPWRERMVQRGIAAGLVQMIWCEQEGGCVANG
ncbi:MAG: hypothetical protein Q9182_002479 [Xanthomendoza sp. 2 TL-2023]